MSDPRTFALDIQRWAAKAKGQMRQFAVEFPQDVAEEIVRDTPVLTGFLRASWYPKWDGPIFHFINGASYAVHVHDGTINMAPRPWVQAVLDRAPLIARATLARISR